MAAKLYVKKVKEKMDTLKSDRQVLHQVLDDYVDAVLSEADKWVSSTEFPGRGYRDICGILDECSNFITEKSGEIVVALGQEDGDEENGEPTSSKESDTAAAALLSATPSSSSLPPSLSSLSSAWRSSPRADYNFLKMKERIDNLENDRENVEKKLKEISDIKSDVSAVSSKVDVLEKGPQHVGFTACLSSGQTVALTTNTVVKSFTQVTNNSGGHFNTSTGEFLAPADGLYVANISHTSNGYAINLHVYVLRCAGTEEEVCASYNADGTSLSACGMGIVSMNKNDRLYVKQTDWNGSIIRSPSSFSCYLIG